MHCTLNRKYIIFPCNDTAAMSKYDKYEHKVIVNKQYPIDCAF